MGNPPGQPPARPPGRAGPRRETPPQGEAPPRGDAPRGELPEPFRSVVRQLEQVETLLNGVAQIDPRPLGKVLADLDPNSRRLVAALPENIERTFELADMVRSGRDHPSVLAQLAAESQLAVHGLVILLTTLQLRSVPNPDHTVPT